jgi:hypothetical protein
MEGKKIPPLGPMKRPWPAAHCRDEPGRRRLLADARNLGHYAGMHLRVVFSALAVAAFAAGPTHASAPETGRGRPDSVFATVGHSEWCPSGHVRLDLDSGLYTLRAPSSWRVCRRPPFRSRIRQAVLAADQMAAVRAAYRNAVAEGLDNPACRNGLRRPDEVVIGNGGIPALRLTSRGQTLSPPRDLTCWSEAARHLHRVLGNMFNPRTARQR